MLSLHVGIMCKRDFLCSVFVSFWLCCLLFGRWRFIWYHPLCDRVIPARMADFNSALRLQPFPCTDFNLHGKWRSHFAKTESYCIVGVICLEVSAEIKNLSTHSVSICKQCLLLPLLIACDPSEQRVFPRESKAPSEIRFINFVQCWDTYQFYCDSSKWKQYWHGRWGKYLHSVLNVLNLR